MTNPVDQCPATRTALVRHLHNLRDVGGIRLANGTTVRTDTLFRSAAPLRESDVRSSDLEELGIRMIVDLRDDAERDLAPAAWDGSSMTVCTIPIFENQLSTTVFADLPDLYEIMVYQRGAAIARAFTALANAGDGAMLVHCTAGKDRTGILIGLALETLGVPRADIIADYVRSQELLGEDYLADLFRGIDPDTLPGSAAHRAVSSPAELLDSALDRVDDEFGGAVAYLLAHGATEEDVAIFRARMLV